MADREVIKQILAQVVVETPKAIVLTIHGEGKDKAQTQSKMVHQKPPDVEQSPQ